MTDKSDKSAITSEYQHISYYLPQWDKNGKCRWVDIQLQHKSLNADAKCIVPPTKVIPIIFIPGVMGTNLKSSVGEDSWKAESIKGADTLWFVPKDGHERRKTLNPDTTTVENRKTSISSRVHSLFPDNGNLLPTRQERHWGEALYLSYGKFLEFFQYALLDDWQTDVYRMYSDAKLKQFKRSGVLANLVNRKLGDTHDSPLTDPELTHFKRFLFSVHVFGYNWLKDNAISAEELTKYIDDVLDIYKNKHGYGLAVEKVILVTHSMGGLVARYAMNPPEGVEFKGCQDKVLGVVHGVIPDLGSPAAYRRMKTGAGKEDIPGQVLGGNAEKLMPVLARAPAPLQLLPYPSYPSRWLKIDGESEYPKVDPFDEIYLRNDVWWKLYQSDIIDSDNAKVRKNWTEYTELMKGEVKKFMLHQEKGFYHPNTYVFYGDEKESDNYLSWRRVSYKREIQLSEDALRRLPAVKNVRFEKQSDGKMYVIPTGAVPHYYFKIDDDNVYELVSSLGKGDSTVPIESLNKIKIHASIKSVLATNVDHQNAYELDDSAYSEFSDAIKFTLRSIIKIVQEVDARAAD